MSKDWDAVAEAINTRMAELGATQAEIAAKAGIGVATLRLIQKAATPSSTRSPRTLAAISTALGLPERHLSEVADGKQVAAGDRIAALEAEIADLRERVDRIEGTASSRGPG